MGFKEVVKSLTLSSAIEGRPDDARVALHSQKNRKPRLP